MTKPTLGSLAVAAALTAAAQTTSFEASNWKSVATVQVQGGDRYGSLQLDANAWKKTEASFQDLRLRDARGGEVPFVVRNPVESPLAAQEYVPLVYDRVITPQGALQFLLDFGASPPIHNALKLRWSDRNFRRKMRIESSAEGKSWDFVKETTLLDYESDGQVFRTEDVQYPATGRRYLRLRIEDWKNPGALVSAVARHVNPAAEQWVDLGAVQTTPSQDAPSPGTQVIEIQLPFAAPEVSRLLIQTSGEEFARAVEVSAELPGQRWVKVCSGTIVRAGDLDQSWVQCGGLPARKLRAAIRNGNDEKLSVRTVRVLAPARELIFPLRPDRPFSLYAGNAVARAPIYDLPSVLRATPAIDPAQASIGEWRTNPAYVPPDEPISERAKSWLSALLVAILAGILLTARFLIRLARRSNRRA